MATAAVYQAPWLLLIETDYVWLKPLVAPPAESSALSIAFKFGYITPQNPQIAGVMRKMYPEAAGPLSDVPASGPAPVLMRWQELFKVRQPAGLASPAIQPIIGFRVLVWGSWAGQLADIACKRAPPSWRSLIPASLLPCHCGVR